MLELLKCVENSPVWSQIITTHDLLQFYQVADVECTGVVGLIIGWIEVDDRARSSYRAHELVHWSEKPSVLTILWNFSGTGASSETHCHRNMYSSLRRDCPAQAERKA